MAITGTHATEQGIAVMIGCPDCNVPIAIELSSHQAGPYKRDDVVTLVIAPTDLPGALTLHLTDVCTGPEVQATPSVDDLLEALPRTWSLAEAPFKALDLADRLDA